MEELSPVWRPATNRSTRNDTLGSWGSIPAPTSVDQRLKDLVGMFFMVTLNATALLANLAVMTAIVKAPHLRKFALVGHLCAVDLLCAVSLMPLGILCSSPFFGAVQLTTLECRVHTSLSIFLICASILTVTAISVERYYYIVHPMRYEVRMTLGLAAVVIAFIWVKSVVLALVKLFDGLPAHGDQGSVSAAHCSLHWSPSRYRRVFAIVFSVMCFCLPAVVIFAVYCSVYKVARLAARQHGSLPAWAATPRSRSDSINSQTTIIATRGAPRRRVRERALGGSKAALTLVVIVGQFMLCWLPYFTFHLRLSLGTTLGSLGDSGAAVTWLAYSSFAVNPFFYGLLNRQIREELCKMRRCFRSGTADLAVSSRKGSVQENFLQFLRRTSRTAETRASCVLSSPKNTLDQATHSFRVPGQIPEDFR